MAAFHGTVDLEDLLEVVKDPGYLSLLEKLAKNHGDSAHRGHFQLFKYNDYETITRTFKLEQVGQDGHVLVWQGSGREEAVLYTQGFIAEHTLPPVMKGTRIPINAAHRAMQSIKLVGPGGEAFAQSIEAIKAIYRFVEQQFRAGKVTPLETPSLGDFPVITAKARYLNPSAHSYWEDASIPAQIDPHGVLSAFVRSGKYKFLTDNEVRYMAYQVDHADDINTACRPFCFPNMASR
ncbi:hypothetical protein C8Q80DRAFT_369241 [Daedaleopsis nitida]|nr:hypothetical protein C8Q80DRAFT_369241 [Daedaleopsis nitida]